MSPAGSKDLVERSPALRSCSRGAVKALLNWCKGEVLLEGEALFDEVMRPCTFDQAF